MDSGSRERLRDVIRLLLADELNELARLGAAVERLEVHVGLRSPPHDLPETDLVEWRRSEAARLRREGLTKPEIAERLNVGLSVVRNDLRGHESVGARA